MRLQKRAAIAPGRGLSADLGGRAVGHHHDAVGDSTASLTSWVIITIVLLRRAWISATASPANGRVSVERAERLVEQQDLRPAGERLRYQRAASCRRIFRRDACPWRAPSARRSEVRHHPVVTPGLVSFAGIPETARLTFS